MEETHSTIENRLTDKGYIISQHRRIIIDHICKIKCIENVDDFWISIRQQHTISWTTVYNTLRLLKELGYVHSVKVDNRQQFNLCSPIAPQDTDCI